MTTRWLDGFEGDDVSLVYENYSAVTTGTTTPFGYGRSMQITGATAVAGKNITASTDVYVGYYYRATAFAIGYIDFYSSGTQHVRVQTNASGGIDIRRGTTVVASSANSLFTLNTWYHVEVHAKIADAGGAVEVRLNGNTTPVATFSGDTKNAGTTTDIDQVRFTGGNNGVTSFIDDLYVNNTGHLGEKRIYTSFATGAGATTGLTPSTGTNWQNVDEAPASATDYNGSAVAGTRDTYAITDLPATPTSVSAVRLTTYMFKSDAGAASMKPTLRVGSTNYYGTTRTLTASQAPYHDIWDTSPDTSSAWTVSEVNGTQLGAEVG